MKSVSLCLFKTICTLFSVLLLVLTLLCRVELAELEETIAQTEKLIEETASQNRALTARYESAISLEELENRALFDFGMQHPTREQIRHIEMTDK